MLKPLLWDVIHSLELDIPKTKGIAILKMSIDYGNVKLL
jgi:hypothetical protein